MKDEKTYLKELVIELKRFFTLEPEEREKAAQNLNDNWQFVSNDDLKISKETEDITSSLLILHHYGEDPDVYDEIIAQILIDVEKRIIILENEAEEEQ